MSTHFYMYITETNQNSKDDNNGDEEYICTYVPFSITKGSSERFFWYNIIKVTKLT